jgi:hypothetical protein
VPQIFIWGGKLLIERLRKHSAALLITAPPETQLFSDYLSNVIDAAAVILDTEHPEQKSTDPLVVRRPSDTDFDAPKVPLPDFNGVAVHGVGEIQNAAEGLLKRTRRCIIVRKNKKTIEGLAEYYKRDVIWVEVAGSEQNAGLKQAVGRCVCASFRRNAGIQLLSAVDRARD